jgi:predicted house-cleaning noncanonical NTP pyrophosphatase (MazG superfamily)
MLNPFNKPYPFNEDLMHNSKIIFFISVGVPLFLFLLQPFDISLLPKRDKYYLIIGFGVITFLSLSLYLLFIPSLFPKKFRSLKWNVKKEIFWNLWILFTILTGYFLYCKTLAVLKFNFNLVIELILTAIIPISALIIINQNRMLRSHLKRAGEINKKLRDNKLRQEEIISFISDYQKDSLAIKVSLLLFIRSANNYIEVFWKDGDSVKNQMVRCSMAYAEELLKEYKFIVKCHRSYIVNISHIDRFEGNLQGYKLYFDKIDFPIPVSKNFASKLQELI